LYVVLDCSALRFVYLASFRGNSLVLLPYHTQAKEQAYFNEGEEPLSVLHSHAL
jgi:hypothetical protein